MDAPSVLPSGLDLALIYRRTSTNKQDNSLEVQESLPTDYCKRMGYEVLKIVEDPDVSSAVPLRRRNGGQELIKLVNLWRVHRPEARLHVVVTKQDRLGRDLIDVISTIRLLWESKVTPHFVCESGGMPRTKENEMMLAMKASFAQYERDTIRDRIKMTLAHRRSQGFATPKAVYGFDREQSGEFKIVSGQKIPVYRRIDNAYEQSWIKQMLKWHDDGLSYQQIATELNKLGVPKKLGGKKWLATNVWRVMNSVSTREWLQRLEQQKATA